MPELAELKLTADYVNFLSEGKVFSHITKNPEHKWKEVKFNDFTIRAESRGKELKLKLDPVPHHHSDRNVAKESRKSSRHVGHAH